MARPRIKIDREQVRQCAMKMWSVKEIAAFFRVSHDTIERRFADLIEEGRQSGYAKLRELQWKRAMEGSDTMIKHMSEHYLEQHSREKKDVDMQGKIEVIVTDYRTKK
jgi:DNA-binding transcriptional regulator YhcF (GntR family)